jgi:hypothetical protein
MDVEGPEEFFLNLSLSESLVPDTWKRIRSFYFGDKDIPHPEDLIKVRERHVPDMLSIPLNFRMKLATR